MNPNSENKFRIKIASLIDQRLRNTTKLEVLRHFPKANFNKIWFKVADHQYRNT